ncbi:hypothetical protein PC9H_000342 [Pleurotus ostreatus]|uniref:Complex 1 LYR protein domain-containing protein n=1 Tax=Pleurotus ostreatus TaxID=5322 RepID=A0A8H7DZ97_PLEOS|nr:uncharacterized protein PC9H_000342 [Pleurotus ostreatus]KAF7440001.1 hypothetical protein PC9H_000342 [Pleurotus ostreatus]
MLKTSNSFSSYNFRNYFVRKTKDTFRSIQNESDPSKIQALYKEAVDDLAVLKRSALVNQVYGGWKLAIERQSEDPAVARERSDS